MSAVQSASFRIQGISSITISQQLSLLSSPGARRAHDGGMAGPDKMAWTRQRIVSDAGARCVLHALSTYAALYLFFSSSALLILFVASPFVAD